MAVLQAAVVGACVGYFAARYGYLWHRQRSVAVNPAVGDAAAATGPQCPPQLPATPTGNPPLPLGESECVAPPAAISAADLEIQRLNLQLFELNHEVWSLQKKLSEQEEQFGELWCDVERMKSPLRQVTKSLRQQHLIPDDTIETSSPPSNVVQRCVPLWKDRTTRALSGRRLTWWVAGAATVGVCAFVAVRVVQVVRAKQRRGERLTIRCVLRETAANLTITKRLLPSSAPRRHDPHDGSHPNHQAQQDHAAVTASTRPSPSALPPHTMDQDHEGITGGTAAEPVVAPTQVAVAARARPGPCVPMATPAAVATGSPPALPPQTTATGVATLVVHSDWVEVHQPPANHGSSHDNASSTSRLPLQAGQSYLCFVDDDGVTQLVPTTTPAN